MSVTPESQTAKEEAMTPLVVYHKSDFDGIFCREIARKFLPEAELIGWEYGEPEPNASPDRQLYILDLSIPGLMNHPRLVWIDHHKSAIEKYATKDGKPWAKGGIQMDGVAACRLAWQYFSLPKGEFIPSKQDFIDRKVTEPLAVRLAGEYDIWDKRDPDAELFQHGLRSRDLTNDWSSLLALDRKATISEIEALIDVGHQNLLRPDGTNPNPTVLGLLENGRALQYAKTQENAGIIKAIGFDLEFEGLKFLVCNHAQFNSHLFTAGIKPEHDALLGFKWTGKDWSCSLYHAPGKEHHDLSLIAVKYGGGGHKGACGFQVSDLPFLQKQSCLHFWFT